jgi:hypothetical protein
MHRDDWIRVRLVGWLLIGIWQLVGIASEFLPIDVDARPVRIAGRIVAFAGLALVAYGFERLVHQHATLLP